MADILGSFTHEDVVRHDGVIEKEPLEYLDTLSQDLQPKARRPRGIRTFASPFCPKILRGWTTKASLIPSHRPNEWAIDLKQGSMEWVESVLAGKGGDRIIHARLYPTYYENTPNQSLPRLRFSRLR